MVYSSIFEILPILLHTRHNIIQQATTDDLDENTCLTKYGVTTSFCKIYSFCISRMRRTVYKQICRRVIFKSPITTLVLTLLLSSFLEWLPSSHHHGPQILETSLITWSTYLPTTSWAQGPACSYKHPGLRILASRKKELEAK